MFLDIELVKKVKDSICDVESDTAFNLASLAVHTDTPDLAIQHDYYLYGVPKREPNDE